VRVTRVDSPRPAREILRKSSLRGGSVVSLAYSTEHHLLSSGCNDGTVQVWSILSDEVEASTARKGQETTDFATPLFAVQLAQSPVVEIAIGMCTGCGTSGSLFLAAAYQNRRVDVVAMNGQAHTCIASTTLYVLPASASVELDVLRLIFVALQGSTADVGLLQDGRSAVDGDPCPAACAGRSLALPPKRIGPGRYRGLGDRQYERQLSHESTRRCGREQHRRRRHDRVVARGQLVHAP